MRLLQESRGAHNSTYLYEPSSYRPLARIDGTGPLEPEHPVAVLALAGEDPRGDPAAGKVRSIPVTNGDASDARHAVAGPVGATARYLAEVEALERGAGPDEPGQSTGRGGQARQTQSASTPSARIYYFHLQPSGLPEEMSDRNGHLVWRAQYRLWGNAVAEEWQAFDATGRPVNAPMAETGIRAQVSASPAPPKPAYAGAVPGPGNGVALQHLPVLRPGPWCLHHAGSNRFGWRSEPAWVCSKPPCPGSIPGAGPASRTRWQAPHAKRA